jgi:hypothetical protein
MLAPGGPAAAKAPFLLDRLPYVTVGLRDGTAMAGWAYAYTVEPVEPSQRELVLATPLKVRPRGEKDFKDAREHFVCLVAEDIRTLSVQYQRVAPQEVPGLLPQFARWIYYRRRHHEDEKIRAEILRAADADDQT